MNHLLNQLKKIESVVAHSKIKRFIYSPLKLSFSFAYRKFFYPSTKMDMELITETFFGKKMALRIPAANDIFLFGIKTHTSEIRLTKYLIKNLKPGHTFFDIGAHFGYYSLLAQELVGHKGAVYAFEASRNNYEVLRKNINEGSNIHINQIAVTCEPGLVEMFEYPTVYSEYNTTNHTQYMNDSWVKTIKPRKSEINGVSVDHYCESENIIPDFIKIDVEGGEAEVAKGMKELISLNSPVIIMEFADGVTVNNEIHKEAAEIFLLKGYIPHLIDNEGEIFYDSNYLKIMAKEAEGSDNIVFVKSSQ